MPPVFVHPIGRYDDPDLPRVIGDMLDRTPARALGAGDRVLVKPNLLLPAPPAAAITTHPAVVRAVCTWLCDAGIRPLVADSPATGSFQRLIRVGGYDTALAGLPVDMGPFEASTRVDIGAPFGRIELAREALAAKGVINLAKLKTHSQMGLTLGVKNLFGCVVGMRKPQWHMRTGVDRRQFARLLVQIHDAVAPVATLVDGILAMEGDGPGKSGTPRHLGLIFGGADSHAVDAAICRAVGLAADDLPTLKAAGQLGRTTGRPDIRGPMTAVTDFAFPESENAIFGPPALQRLMRRLMRRTVLQRPTVDPSRCRQCGECWSYCPADAVRHAPPAVVFDTAVCIRCYCCVEVCPHGALTARRPPLGRLLHRLGVGS